MALAGAATGASGGGPGEDEHSCSFSARAHGSGAIEFRTRCDIEPFQLKVRPSTGVRQVARTPMVSPARPGDGFRCERRLRGKIASCEGHMEDGARLIGRLRTRGESCDGSIRWAVAGGVDCDAGEVCPAIALLESGEVRRPRGC